MTISVNGLIVSDETGASLLFVETKKDGLAGGERWATDFANRLAKSTPPITTIAAALAAAGFAADSDASGPDVDGRIRNKRADALHAAKVGDRISKSQSDFASDLLVILTNDGPALGISAGTIAKRTEELDSASDEADISLLIDNLKRPLIRVGLWVETDRDSGSTGGPADAQPEPTSDSTGTLVAAGSVTEWGDDEANG